MYPAADGVIGLSLSSRTERGYVIAALGGELDIAAAPMLREKLLVMIGPAALGILSVLNRQPLTHSPAVAATASRLRILLDPDRLPAHTRATDGRDVPTCALGSLPGVAQLGRQRSTRRLSRPRCAWPGFWGPASSGGVGARVYRGRREGVSS